VYGLLFSAATFRAVFLSSAATGVAVEALSHHGGLRRHAGATLSFGVWLAFGMATGTMKGKMRVVLFTLIYFGTLMSILLWRL
jgi:hypothetical protein